MEEPMRGVRLTALAILGLALLAAPWLAEAQQPTMPVIGFVRSSSIETVGHLVAAFRQGLKEAGYFEGQNVAIEFRSADDHYERLPAIVTGLIQLPVAVIVANSTAPQFAKTATTTVPIVFATGGDPVRDGLVVSFNRPGGNVTGVSFLGSNLGGRSWN
jgi:putative ABC transport system substrate-binding protein